MSIGVKEAINPKTNQLIKEGDVVLIYQGRFGHNNIMTIKSIWDHGSWIGVSKDEDKMSTDITAIKEVISPAKLKKLKKDISLFNRLKYLEEYRFIN
jgi:hypothetical protein